MKKIHSVIPGVFYQQPTPEQQPYKKAGDSVAKGDVIGLVEVMKSYHEIKSQSDGVFLRYVVDNEGELRAGQVIAELEE